MDEPDMREREEYCGKEDKGLIFKGGGRMGIIIREATRYVLVFNKGTFGMIWRIS